MTKWKTPNNTYIEDIIGQTFNRLTVVEYPKEKNSDNRWVWGCKCSCGNSKLVWTSMHKLKTGNTKSCGCMQKEAVIAHNKDMSLDLTGYKKDNITVLYKTNDIASGGCSIWHCKCTCGNEFNLPINEIRRDKYGDGTRQGALSCPECSVKSNGEKKILTILKNNNIVYEREKIFNNCINPKTNYNLRFDFYLPDYNCCIEYDGIQHFKPSGSFFTQKFCNEVKYRDNIKEQYCVNNNISLIRIPYTDYNKLNWEYLSKRLVMYDKSI